MNLEDQVCSLELSKKLKKLGIEQKSLWGRNLVKKYETGPIKEMYATRLYNINSENSYSAFTASELADLLPKIITVPELAPFDSYRLNISKSCYVFEDLTMIDDVYIVQYFCDTTECTGEDAWIGRTLLNQGLWDSNLANVLAKTLIQLIEDKYLGSQKEAT